MKKIIVLMFFAILLTGCTAKAEIFLEAGIDTIEVFDEHDLKACTVVIKEVEYEMNVENNDVDNTEVGEYLVNYEEEVDGKVYTCQRVVFVVDQTPPNLTLLPGIDTVQINESWTDAGVDVVDNYDQDVVVMTEIDEDNLAATSSISFKTAGTFEVKYIAMDDAGNEASIIRYIHVLEGE